MHITELKGKVTLKWLNFIENRDEIIGLRRKVFMDGQGFDEDFIHLENDEKILHLGAYFDGKLVSVISANVIKGTNSLTQALNLPDTEGYKFQLTKRAEIKELRGTRLAELIATYIWLSVVQCYEPDYAFIELMQVHKKLGLYYSSFGYKFDGEATLDGVEMNVYLQDRKSIDTYSKKIKRLIDVISSVLDIELPPLETFLEDNPFLLQPKVEMSKNNLYLNTLSFKDELPRLLAQARLLSVIQKDFISEVEFPKAPGNFLDIGCGPGLYLNFLSKQPNLKGYKFFGMDISQEMVTYAKFSYPKISWKQGTIYETKYDDNTFDVIHSSFLFIHLTNPRLALQELYRILKPGGKLYIVDVNDSTFKGPAPIKRAIMKHEQYYEGNRSILNSLPKLAKNNSFTLSQSFKTIVENTGRENAIQLEGNVLKLGRMKLWAMFSFVSQREDVQKYYQKAEKYYFKNMCKISVEMQTQIYEKNK